MGGAKIRTATPADLPAILKVVLEAMRKEPLWSYCFPYRAKYAGDHLRHTEALLKQYLESTSDDLLIQVMETPVIDEPDSKNIARIVSVAVWDKSSLRKEKESADGERHRVLKEVAAAEGDEARKDAVAARILAMNNAITESRQKYLDSYGQQMYLHLLATLPEYQKLGYAKALCGNAMEEARAKSWAVSALASPTGYIFYSGLGFVDCGYTKVKSQTGDADDIILKAMVSAPPKADRRGSWFGLLPDSRRSSTYKRPSVDGSNTSHESRRSSFLGVLGVK